MQERAYLLGEKRKGFALKQNAVFLRLQLRERETRKETLYFNLDKCIFCLPISYALISEFHLSQVIPTLFKLGMTGAISAKDLAV